MQLEDYFDFETHTIEPFGAVETIQFRGSRIDIEFVILPFLDGDSPERIYQAYRHSLNLEQVYAAITFYLRNKQRIGAYLKTSKEIKDHHYQDYLKSPPSEALQKLRKLKAEREAGKTS